MDDNPYKSPYRAEPLAPNNDIDIDGAITAVAASDYFSTDIAPVPMSRRRWGTRDLAVLWISMSACIPTYMLAASLIELGMDWRQAISTIVLANCIVLVPMILNAHAGTRYGIPFPVYCRAAFGIRGANVPALMRAMVACGWFGIQTWIGGMAIFTLLAVWFPSMRDAAKIPHLDISLPQLVCFLAFWLLNIIVVWCGIESIRVLLNIKAPLLIALGLLLLAWAYKRAGGFGPMLSQPSQFAPGEPKAGQFWAFFFPALTANVGFWATLSLNIPDFSRYAYSQRDQVLGQAIGLPTTMGLYSFIGVAVTSATVIIYGKAIWDPVQLLTRFDSVPTLVIAMISLCLATLATNIAANVVGPANDFAHLRPKLITFRIGGLITGIFGILIQPWRLLANSKVYIDKWLIGYSSLLGACGGVLIADYYVLRRTRLDLQGLYRRGGPYWYTAGINPWAMIALVLGIAPCLPGFAATNGLMQVPEIWSKLYDYAWFISFGVSFASYLILMLAFGRKRLREAASPAGVG
jgi:NCS1 family nucleobase:cation symporter-1